MTNADIFEKMEKEMKHIMELFAKERKARKNELSKLQMELEERNILLDEIKQNHMREKQ